MKKNIKSLACRYLKYLGVKYTIDNNVFYCTVPAEKHTYNVKTNTITTTPIEHQFSIQPDMVVNLEEFNAGGYFGKYCKLINPLLSFSSLDELELQLSIRGF